jgi:hypothetical protein
MKNLIKKCTILILVAFLPIPLLFSLFDFDMFLILYSILIGVLGFIFLFADKILLSLLNSRDIVESEYDYVFQLIKHESFVTFIKSPKLYSYRGLFPKAFILKGRKNFVLIFEESIFETLTKNELSALINFLLGEAKKGNAQILTLAYIFIILIVKALLVIRESILFITKNITVAQSLFLCFLLFFKPILLLLFWIGVNNDLEDMEELRTNHFLKSAFLKLYSIRISESYSDKLFLLNKMSKTRSKIISSSFLEIFPSNYSKLKKVYD